MGGESAWRSPLILDANATNTKAGLAARLSLSIGAEPVIGESHNEAIEDTLDCAELAYRPATSERRPNSHSSAARKSVKISTVTPRF